MTDKEKQFKNVLTSYIQEVQKQHETRSKRGGVFAAKTVYGDKYLSEKNYINLKGLYNFATRNKNLTSNQIEEFIKANESTFKFLNKYVTIVPDAIRGLRVYGYDHMAIMYKEQLKAEKVVEGVKGKSK